jgi:hypothetical protein
MGGELAVGAAGCDAGAPGGGVTGFATMLAPQWPQNRNPGGTSAWHWGHVAAKAAPHCPQNLMPGGFSNAHAAHRGPAGMAISYTSPRSRAVGLKV